ncbi:MAG: ArsA family ATPase [Candidatus Thorarchaeota archaeon]|nr:ArsA family ATPase [Candidatus Thorarchaeota archaeon]
MNLRDIIYDKDIKFILSGGKGGVGKTSCAGAIAVLSAEYGLRTLVISTDPAHSLSDSIDQNLSGGDVIKVEGIDNLWGMEINTEKGMREFQENLGQMQGPEVEMASQLMGGMDSMPPPGSDEAMAFGKMLEFIGDPNYDRVVFDTAPTGHTLKLLELPDLLDSWLGKMLTLRQRISSMMSGFKAFLGGAAPEEDDSWKMLQQTKEKIRAASVMLADEKLTQFVVVMIPEAMAVFETQRLLSSLNKWSIPVSNIIVNQLVPENPSCPFCTSRRRMQQSNLVDIRELYHDLHVTEVPLFDHEIRGIDELRRLGHILINEETTQ